MLIKLNNGLKLEAINRMIVLYTTANNVKFSATKTVDSTSPIHPNLRKFEQ
jgi:hypothetical protein